mgnify:CR=1 FL=1
MTAFEQTWALLKADPHSWTPGKLAVGRTGIPASYECIICGKGIKHSSKHYSIVAGGGHEMNLIHKDEWDYASSTENKDGGFMDSWDIGSECVKKLKHIPNIKNYISKPIKEVK